ncbi:MAG: ribonuclease E/G, partial [Lachnospiraceae bacterium]|nr:ribonuclease E/G [Lachnospiraceae bacterium]
MKTLNKLIFTTLRGRRAAVLASDKRILQFEFEGETAAGEIGTIYIGKVRNVVKNLNAAFVEYKPG